MAKTSGPTKIAQDSLSLSRAQGPEMPGAKYRSPRVLVERSMKELSKGCNWTLIQDPHVNPAYSPAILAIGGSSHVEYWVSGNHV